MSDREYGTHLAEESGLVAKSHRVSCHTINPESRFRIAWDTIAIFVVLWSIWIVPFRIAYLENGINAMSVL